MLPPLGDEANRPQSISAPSPVFETVGEFTPRLVLREEVILEARTWIGTPYHHMARVKGAGVDCGQLPLGVYHAAGCIPYIKTRYYPPDFFMHRNEEWYKGIVETYADEIPEREVLPADMVLYRFGRLFAHGGIVDSSGWPGIIHANRGKGKVVVDTGLAGDFRLRDRIFFRPKAFSSGG